MPMSFHPSALTTAPCSLQPRCTPPPPGCNRPATSKTAAAGKKDFSPIGQPLLQRNEPVISSSFFCLQLLLSVSNERLPAKGISY
jgi:hypothetical protein